MNGAKSVFDFFSEKDPVVSRRAFLEGCGAALAIMSMPINLTKVFAADAFSAQPVHRTLTWSLDPRTTQSFAWTTAINDAAAGSLQVVRAAEYKKSSWKKATNIDAVTENFKTNTDTVLLHSVTATGLQAGETYFYRLGSEGDWSEPQQFTTEAETAKKVKFLVFGDSQSGKASNPEYGPWGKTIRNAYEANPDAAFFMNVGDLVEIGQDYAHWKNWYTAAQDVIEKLPAMAVPGNHETYDVADESHSTLPVYFTKQLHLPMNGPKELAGQVYSFDYGNVHFAVLDSQEEEEGSYVASMLEKEAAWLAKDLAATKQPWKLVFFHRTPYYNKATRANENVKKAFAGVIDQYHVDLVINGHDHGYSRTYPIYQDAFVDSPAKGTVYLVTGRSGNKYYTDLSNKVWDAFFHDPQAEPNYVVIETEGDILTVRGVTQSGDLIDTYRIDKKKGIDTPQTSLPERCQQTLMAVWGDLLQTPLLDVPPQEIEGSWYVPLESLLDFAGGTFTRTQDDQVQAVYKKTTALLQKDAAKAMVNGQEHPLQHPLRSYHGASLLSTADVQQIFGFNSKYDAALNILFLVR